MIKMNKKGFSMSMLTMMELGAVLLVGFLAFTIGTGLAKQDTTLRIYTVESIQMMVHTLAGIPGDALVYYPVNVSDYSFIIDSSSVAMFKSGESRASWTTKNFNLPDSYIAEGVIENAAKVCLEKKERNILLRGCPESE